MYIYIYTYTYTCICYEYIYIYVYTFTHPVNTSFTKAPDPAKCLAAPVPPLRCPALRRSSSVRSAGKIAKV